MLTCQGFEGSILKPMEKTILVTGKDTFLGSELCRHFREAGQSVVTTHQPRTGSGPDWGQEEGLELLAWSRRSAVSTKNVALALDSCTPPLSEVYVIFSPGSEKSLFHEVQLSELESKIDDQSKGFAFLSRELISLALRKPFQINFLFYDDNPEDLPPLAYSLYQGAKALVSGLMKKYKSLEIWGFECFIPQPEAFLDFVVSHTRDGDPRITGVRTWQILKEKKSFFSQFSRSQEQK